MLNGAFLQILQSKGDNKHIVSSVTGRRSMGEEIRRSNSRDSLYSAYSKIGDWEVGDRCKVGGRNGNIVFIGPTSFAPGEWVGVVLDEPTGRNDGSVEGTRYFKCAPNHGLFCKASKLERLLTSPIAKSPAPEASTSSEYSKNYGCVCLVVSIQSDRFDIGDRVVVSGGKLGTVRFLGLVDFQEGIWAGIELDTPQGKNDGSVQGKRYFTAKPLYGLFASAAKVTRVATQGPAKLKVRQTKASTLRQRTGSQESLSSLGTVSLASSRISRTAFTPKPQAFRPIVIASNQGQSEVIKSLQETLREKEKHIEQMIKERDFEKSEMARMATQGENAAKLAGKNGLTNENEIASLKKRLSDSEAELLSIHVQLKEKNEEAENLRFLLDEEKVLNEELKERLNEAEKLSKVKLDSEMSRIKAELREKELLYNNLQDQFAEEKSSLDKSYCQRLEELMKELEMAKGLLNEKVKEFSTLQDTKGTLQNEIERLRSLCTESRNEAEDAKMRVLNFEMAQKELKEANKREKDAFEDSLKKAEEENVRLRGEIAKFKEDSKLLNEREILISTLTTANEELNRKLKNLEGCHEDLNEKIELLGKRSLAAEQKCEAGQHAFEEFKETIAVERNQQNLEYMQQVGRLTTQLSLAEDQKRQLEEALKTVRAEMEATKKLCENAEEKLKEVNERAEKWKSEFRRIEQDKAVLMRDSDSLGIEVMKFQARIDELAEQLNNANLRNELLEATVKANADREEGVVKKQTELDQTLTTALQNVEKLQSEVTALQTERDKLQNESNELDKELRGNKADLSHLLLKLEELEDDDILGPVTPSFEESIEEVSGNPRKFEKGVLKARYNIDRCTNKIRFLEHERAKIQMENDQLKSQLGENKIQIEELISQVQILESEKGSFEVIDMVRANLEKKLENANGTIQELQEKIITFEQERDSLEQEKGFLWQELTTCRTQIEEFVAQLKQMDKENKKMKKEAKTVAKAKSAMETRLGEAEEKIKTLGHKLEMTKGKTNLEGDALHSSQLRELHEKCELLNSGNNQLKAENESLKSCLMRVEDTKLNLEAHLKEAYETIEELKIRNRSEAEEVLEMDDKAKDLEEAQTAIHGEVEQLKSQVEKLTAKNMDLQSTLKAAEAEVKALKRGQRRSEDLEFNICESEKMIEDLNIKLDSIAREKQSMEEQLTLRELQARGNGARIVELTEENEALRSENDDLRDRIGRLQSETATSADDKQSSAVLKDDFTKFHAQIAILVSENEKLKNDLKQTKAELEKRIGLVGELSKLQKELKGRDCEVELLHSLVKKLELERDEAKAEELSSENGQGIKKFEKPQVLSVEELARETDSEQRNEKLQKEISVLKEKLFALEQEKIDGEIIISEAKQRSALFEELNDYWKKQEAGYLKTISELEASSRKDETQKIEELHQQISFLNSIIADKQIKEADLREQISILNNLPAKDALSGLPKNSVPLRSYCDICEEFDLHDTSDCAKQATNMEEYKSHSHFASDGKPSRPYCENCEAFLHDTTECPNKPKYNDETF